MNSPTQDIPLDPLPFFITGPGGMDILFGLVALVLVLALLGFGALYFTIQAIPDRMASGMGKTQLQVVSILGLISLFTMNNAFWIAAILLAAVPLTQITLPIKIRSDERRDTK
ncbi:MAG: hypothetical protein ABJJ37_25940 [Roseibium sp.]